MSERGVFAVDRSIFSDPDFADEPFTEREAWLYLVGAAAWRPIRVRGADGKLLDLARGEFSYSVRYLADAWGWSKDRAHRFLQRLKNRDMVRDVSRDGSRDTSCDGQKIYFIKNYSKFQVVGLPECDGNRDASRDSIGDTPRDTSATAPRQIRNIKTTSAKAEDAAASGNLENPPSQPTDIRGRLFQDGLRVLAAITGKPEASCRSLIGRWLRDANDDAKRVLRAIEDARDEQAADPVAWIAGALKRRSARRQPASDSVAFAFERF